jgi:hypothetical protein
MRTLAEVTIELDEQGEEGETLYMKKMYYLLHWGIKHQIIETEAGKLLAVNRTVAICQEYETGQVECFEPEQLRIIGMEVKS